VKNSRKEEQRRIREARQQEAKRRKQIFSLAWKAALVVLVPLVVGVLLYGLGSNARLPAPSEITEGDHVRGSADARVTLTMYGDFQCPACMEEAEVIASAWRRIGDNVRLVFRHYPLDTHPHAFKAAQYAEAAARQGRFWEMYNQLYGNQALWYSASDATLLFDGFAREIGLDLEQLKADAASPEVRQKIQADQRGGTRAGVRSTPTLFINGKLVPTPPRSALELEALVTRELRR